MSNQIICRGPQQISRLRLMLMQFTQFENLPTFCQGGFSLTELLVAVSIVGILSSIALPSYLKQVTKTHQNEAATTLSQLQQKLASYVDVFKAPPPSWKAFSDYSLVMTASGPASETGSVTTTAINLPGNNYRVRIETAGTNLYTFLAEPLNQSRLNEGYNVIACLDLNNGASDIKKGPIKRSPQDLNKEPRARADDLVCRACMASGNCS